jgi:hypothetical protein
LYLFFQSIWKSVSYPDERRTTTEIENVENDLNLMEERIEQIVSGEKKRRKTHVLSAAVYYHNFYAKQHSVQQVVIIRLQERLFYGNY